MTPKRFILVILIALAVMGGILYFTEFKSKTGKPSGPSLLTPNPQITYASFSLQGKVMTVSSTKIVFNTMIPYNTVSGVVLQPTVKTILINSNTQFFTSKGAQTTYKSLQAGSEITVFYAGSPIEVPQQLAVKIVIK